MTIPHENGHGFGVMSHHDADSILTKQQHSSSACEDDSCSDVSHVSCDHY